MELVIIMTRPKDVEKFGERVAAFWKATMIGGQIARDDVRTRTGYAPGDARANGTEVVTAREVTGKIDASGVLIEERIPGVVVLSGGIGSVAAVAIGLRVDDIAADSHEVGIQSF